MKFRARGRIRGAKVGMNKTEAEYEMTLMARKNAGEIHDYRFEKWTTKLADDTRYTADFMVILSDGCVEFHEVKGWGFEDDALVKIKVAAEQNPWFTFRSFTKRAKKHGGGWEERVFGTKE